MYTHIFFDLDGTITDSKEGITNSLQYAFDEMGIGRPSEEVIDLFLGPPLCVALEDVFGLCQEDIDKTVAKFRERYVPIGAFENKVYPGMEELLKALYEDDRFKLYIATSKPEVTAKKVLEHFNLTPYFEVICGATLTSDRIKKADVIACLLHQIGDVGKENILMIGDRNHDVEGAHANGISACGVLYGYGCREELLKAGAEYIVESVEELRQLLLGEVDEIR